MKLTVSSVCDTGKLRRKNQDAILVYQDEEKSFALFLVADGMGGHYYTGQNRTRVYEDCAGTNIRSTVLRSLLRLPAHAGRAHGIGTGKPARTPHRLLLDC